MVYESTLRDGFYVLSNLICSACLRNVLEIYQSSPLVLKKNKKTNTKTWVSLLSVQKEARNRLHSKKKWSALNFIIKYTHRKCEYINLPLQSSIFVFLLIKICLQYMFVAILVCLSSVFVCCFVFSFKQLQLSTNHARWCEFLCMFLVSVGETLAETANKWNKSVCKNTVFIFATFFLDYQQNLIRGVVAYKGGKIWQMKWDLQRWHRL